MGWSCGIVGLPNAGKSTLFKAVTALDVTIESYPFSTVDPNVAVVPLPDQRLEALAKELGSVKATPPAIRVVDVAGLVEGASRGEGLGNRFLGELREVDLLIHVVARFDAGAGGETDPVTRASIVNTELILADMETVDRRRERLAPKLKSGDKQAARENALLNRLYEHLNCGMQASLFPLAPEEKQLLDQLFLLTAKPMIYVLNQPESSPMEISAALAGLARAGESPVLPLCARLEAELAELPATERTPFLREYGLERSMVQQLLAECYRLLNLVTVYTVKGTEARAWIVPIGTKAVEAAGKVHSDMAKGFINMEVVSWDDLLAAGSLAAAREKGAVHVEGRDYPVKDGDVLYIRFRG